VSFLDKYESLLSILLSLGVAGEDVVCSRKKYKIILLVIIIITKRL
jgi:hypothetical protein